VGKVITQSETGFHMSTFCKAQHGCSSSQVKKKAAAATSAEQQYSWPCATVYVTKMKNPQHECIQHSYHQHPVNPKYQAMIYTFSFQTRGFATIVGLNDHTLLALVFEISSGIAI